MYIPHTVTPTVAGGGERGSMKVPAKWDSREYVPFYSIKESDRVDESACATCAAPLRSYEVNEHEMSCAAIAASNGKDKPIRKVEAETPEAETEEPPTGGPHPSELRTRPGH